MTEAITFARRYQPISMAIPATGSLLLRTDHGTLDFEAVFKTHFRELHAYAFTIVDDHSTAEEMVQNVFLRLWEKKDQLEIHSSATAYLYRSVYHECLNHLKHRKVRKAYQAHLHALPHQDGSPAGTRLHLGELQQHLSKAINELPEQCRTIFQLSRFEELKYHQIATKLGISVKTVENQMGKALRILREKLVDFLPLLLITLFNY